MDEWMRSNDNFIFSQKKHKLSFAYKNACYRVNKEGREEMFINSN